MMIRRYAAVFAVTALAGLVSTDSVSLAARQRATGGSSAVSGASSIQLPDGRWLIVGGEDASGVLDRWSIVDTGNGATVPVSGSLPVPRTRHTATVLPDGSVLIVGGRNAGGLVESAELFDPASRTFTGVVIAGSVPRAQHTTTLLTDGRLLVTGGSTGATEPAPVEMWDLQTRTAERLPGPAVDRTGHNATLLADGRVQISGGRRIDGVTAEVASIVDPIAKTVGTGDGAPAVDAPRVAWSTPATNEKAVPLNTRMVVRFSEAMRVETINGETVGLEGPHGRLATTVIGAEQGRLAFVWPLDTLEPGERYTLTVRGATSARGVSVVPAEVAFTTLEREHQNAGPEADPEAWTPAKNGANGWRSERPSSPWETLAALMAPSGVTAVSGRVLRLDGRPLPDVTLEIEGHETRTDRTGRFLLPLEGVVTGEQTLEIDARSANKPNRTYGFYEARIGVRAGITNVLPFTIWSPLIDTAHQVTIASPTTAETVISTPLIPGLELHLPAGTVIRDEDGEIVRTISITPIPLDRTPFPLPADATFTMFFTIQPGGAYLHTPGPIKGGWLVYPRNGQSPPGKRVQFFDYDPEDKGWYVYGMGTVTATQVVPDAKTRLYAFTGASFNDGNTPPPVGPPPGDCCGNDGDPVNLTTGIFTYQMTDLEIPDVMPLALTRTYNSQDIDPSSPRPFGIGMTHPYAIFLHTEQAFEEADLILPDGGRIHYVKSPESGPNWYQTIFEHTTSPTGFYKSRIAFWGAIVGLSGWELKQKDGTVYVFGHGAPLQAIRDRHGNEIRLTWSTTNFFGSGTGNLMRVTSPNGRWIEFTYYAGTSRVYQAKDNIGRTVTYTYDASGRLSTVTDPENYVTSYTWDANHRMTGVKPPNLQGTAANLVTNEYTTAADAPTPVGWVKTQTFPDGGVYQFAYTVSNGKSTQTDVTNPRAFVRRVTFNAEGYVLTDARALGQPEQQVTSYTRQPGTQLVTSVTDPLNRQTSYTYDASGHVLTSTYLEGTSNAAITTYTYEPQFGQVATVTDPLNHTTTIGFDSRGHRTSVTDPLNHTATIEYNSAGQITKLTDPLQHSIEVTYTGADISTITDPLGRVTTRFYDAAGRMLSHTGPAAESTRYTYDKRNRVTQVTDPLNGTTNYSYGAFTQVTGVTDPLDHTTTFGYDAFGRVTSRTDPLTMVETFGYDLTGNPNQRTDRRGKVISQTYDGHNRLTEVTYADTSTTAYTYDGGNRLKTIVDSVDGTITRTYDDFDNLTSESSSRGTVSYTSDMDGRRTTMTVAGQPVVLYEFDDADRLTSLTQGAAVVTLAYDDANRRSSLTLPNGIVVEYGYDAASQVTGITYKLGATTLGTLTYAYDAAGRRTEVGGTWARTGLPQAVTSATYDAANRVVQWMGHSLMYDANGNLASDGLTNYMWNARNQLSGTTGEMSADFVYDGTQRRVSRTVSGQAMSFLYDNENIVQELAGGAPVAGLLTNLTLDESWGRTDGQTTTFTLADALGSPVARVDATGALQTQYTYEAFGRSQATGAADANPFGYTGRENDAHDLYFYRARYYNPRLQRFISEDPADLAGGLNLYAYVDNRPLDLTDPTGLNPLKAFCDSVRRKISNLKKSIERREADYLANKLNLPEACAFDWVNPSLSRRGHRNLISDDKVNLAFQEILLSLFCNGNSTPGTPQLVPQMPPIPVPPPPTPQQQVVIVGAAGTAILAYWWVFIFAL